MENAQEPLIKGPNDYPASSLQGDAQVEEEQVSPDEEAAAMEEWSKAEIALKRVLYDGGMLKQLVKSVIDSGNAPSAIADGVLAMMKALDERTQGQIPEDFLLPLATMAVAEVAEGLEAAGRDVPSADLAEAMKQMLVKHMTEFGADPAQVEQQMSQVDMQQLIAAMDQARAEVGGEEEEMPEEEPAEEEPESQPLIGRR